jgi:hypothetical protein
MSKKPKAQPVEETVEAAVEATEETVETVAEPTEKATETEEIKAYIGPTIPGVARGTVFNNGISEILKKAAEDMPAFKSLIVPLAELNKAQTELQDKNSARARMYKLVLTKYNQGGIKNGL